MTQSNFADVLAFHRKFGLPHPDIPQLLEPGVHDFRLKFMEEELVEYADAVQEGDLPKAADSLIDLVYVAMGTAVMMGIPWQLLWEAVQNANMQKVRCESKDDSRSTRGHAFDVVKPEGWEPPKIEYLLHAYTQQKKTARQLAFEVGDSLPGVDHGDMAP